MKPVELQIGDQIVAEWQDIVDMTATIIGVPAGLVMRLGAEDIEVFVSSRTEGNPYNPGDKEHFQNSGLYCETVIKNTKRLLVPNALADPAWKDNPDVKLNMISYLGYPILLPDGQPFGTICVLDNKENSYSGIYENLLEKMQGIIQGQLALAFMNQSLGDENKRLEEYIAEIEALRKLIPICSHCKQVRNDDGFWEKVEEYLGKHIGVNFTHGICPDCLEKHYPNFVDKI